MIPGEYHMIPQKHRTHTNDFAELFSLNEVGSIKVNQFTPHTIPKKFSSSIL